jgi:hypothetical protein
MLGFVDSFWPTTSIVSGIFILQIDVEVFPTNIDTTVKKRVSVFANIIATF